MAGNNRGTAGFEVDESGNLIANPQNVAKLRDLWRSRPPGLVLGPGVSTNDGGAWHVACHVIAGGCVRQDSAGELLWLEVSHVGASDTYIATVSAEQGGTTATVALDSEDGRRLLEDSVLLGYVEGTSLGRISARGVTDSPGRFGSYLRQDYDQPPGSQGPGGRVWEHWCTSRDLDPASSMSQSLLLAYVQLCGAAGDRFCATVARGRQSYGHPGQLQAMLDAGFTTASAASWQVTPQVIPQAQELLLQEASPEAALSAVKSFRWSAFQPSYFMFERKIADFR